MSHPDPYRPQQPPGPYPPGVPYPPNTAYPPPPGYHPPPAVPPHPPAPSSGDSRGWRFLDGLLMVLTGVVGKDVGTARDRVLTVLAIFAVVFVGLAAVIWFVG